jgi:hypothetical protein
MRRALIFLFSVATLGAADITFSVNGLKTPVFDASGHLIRRLTAVSAIGPIDSPHLEKGQFEFFAVGSADHPVAVLDFEQADYQKSEERISGADAIKLTTDEATVSGQGYICQLELGLLSLKSQVQYSSGVVRLSGDQADINFDPKGLRKDEIIKEIVVTGTVVVEPTARSARPFDRAETTYARFDAERQRIYLKTPVTLWKNGQKAVNNIGSGFFEIDLKEKPNHSP